MKFNFVNNIDNVNTFVVGFDEEKKILLKANILDHKIIEILQQSILEYQFNGKIGESVSLTLPYQNKILNFVIIGCGNINKFTPLIMEKIGQNIYNNLKSTKNNQVAINIDNINDSKLGVNESIARICFGIKKASWKFEKYKTESKGKNKHNVDEIFAITNNHELTQDIFTPLSYLADGVALCKDLSAEPGNRLYPETYVDFIQKSLSPLGIKINVLDKKAMHKLGMGCLLGVAQGSNKDPYLVTMEWSGGDKSQKPYAFVGKGITFDTGGISLKPPRAMEEMKYDMCGSAAVVGLMKVLALRKAKINVVSVVALAENMPSGAAIKPGDVLDSMSGKTVEITNTDAEGRLVLADALWYTQDKYKPQFMINIATLTGAMIYSLGDEFAGLMSNNDELSTQLTDVGVECGDEVWRLPMHPEFEKTLQSYIADLNHCPMVAKAGSVIAGHFLEQFVNNVPWVHLDIAGVAWKPVRKTSSEGATGFGVQILDGLLKKYYEK